MSRIAVATGSRADYHLLVPTLRRIDEDPRHELDLVVTGAHLSPKYGMTCKAIEEDGFDIRCRIPILGNGDTSSDVDAALARELEGFDAYLVERHPDLVIILGDRYEMLSVATASMMHHVPIAHLHGGEKTVGAIDDNIRHAITKMSTLHFVSCEEHRRRVIQLGEDPARVFNVGACGIENVMTVQPMPRDEFFANVGLDQSRPFYLVTYHPTTLGGSPLDEVAEVLAALDTRQNEQLLFTKANADSGGDIINKAIEEYVSTHRDAVIFASLGMRRYLTALGLADAVVGNSSSGLLEAPSFGVPTVNIGTRQQGRVRASSVIDCACTRQAIMDALEKASSPEFIKVARHTTNPFGDGHVSERIMRIIDQYLSDDARSTEKDFYDIDFDYPGRP